MYRATKAALLPLLMLAASLSIAGETRNYRLAGTLEAARGEWLALLELPGGEQRLLRQGDVIAGGEVVGIGPSWLTLREQQGELTLTLEGDSSYARYQGQNTGFADVVASASLIQSLERLGTAGSDPGQLTRGLRRLLQIPGDGDIVGIDDQAVESDEQTLDLLLKLLGENRAVRIEVSGVEGFDAVYLTPTQETRGTRDE